ncbi:hypothetical protein BJV74DRAFT_856335 [Russula compacta]|nr:hypothetical protein BJV74DRAFT_856335 [Russula compacta]
MRRGTRAFVRRPYFLSIVHFYVFIIQKSAVVHIQYGALPHRSVVAVCVHAATFRVIVCA